jgi:membrane peptidoglycan carboxypeptidase
MGAFNEALVAINPKNGEILAMVGSENYFGQPYPKDCLSGKNSKFEPKFNIATLGERQPGSAFKPFVYATAFSKGYDDTDIVNDEETDFGVWGGKHYIPQNYDHKFRGPVTLRQALAQSLNVPAVKVLVDLAGIKESVQMAKNLGISTLKEASFYGPSLVLGAGEVKLLEMVSAYGVFADNGLKNAPAGIIKIEDSRGNVVQKHLTNAKRVLSAKTAKMISDILADNEARAPMFGSRSALYLENERVSVKTGSTQHCNNAWTIGYNQNISAGVWVGNNDNSPSYKQPGVVLAAPIWKMFMEEAIKARKNP